MAQAGQLREANVALHGLEAKVALTRALLDQVTAPQVLFPLGRPHEDVVQVHQADDPLQTGKGRVHHALEDGRRVAQAERHDQVLEKTAVAHKGRPQLGALGVLDLPKLLEAS